MTQTTTIKAGESAKTITLTEGKSLTITGSAGAVGVAYLLDPTLGGMNSLQSWVVGAGALPAIGPYANTQKIHLTCAAGDISATTQDAVLTATGSGGGASDIAFSLAIPLASGGSAYMPQQTVTGPMTFTVMPNAVRNSLVYLRLVGNGVDTPDTSAFKEWGGSLGYNKSLGIVNQAQFFHDGYDAYVSYTQVIGATAIDTTPPTVSAAAVANATPTVVNVTFNEALAAGSVPAASAFTVTGHTVSSVAVSGSIANVTVTPAFVNGETARTMNYTQPGTNGLRDAAGNQVVSFTNRAISNNVAAVDTVAPLLQALAMNGATLTATYNETLNTAAPTLSAFGLVVAGGAAVAPTAASVSGAVVTLTFAAVTNGQTLSLSYTPGASAIRDTANNNAAAFSGSAVTNNTPASDTTVPVIQSAAMNGASLVMTYNEALTANSPTLASLSLVVDGGAGVNPTAATASGTTVTLTFATPVTSGQTLALTYTAGATAIKDAASNNAANLTAYSVTNNTAATGSSPLRFSNATTGGTIYYTEVVGGDGSYTYNSNGNVNNNVFAAASSPVSDISLPAGQDGSFSHGYAGDAASGVMIMGFKTGATKPANSVFSAWDCMLQTPASVGGAYVTKTGAGANQTSSVLSAAGDVPRLRRAGTAVIAEVARAADLNTWITIATPIASGSTGVLWGTFSAQTTGRTIENTRYSGAWA